MKKKNNLHKTQKKCKNINICLKVIEEESLVIAESSTSLQNSERFFKYV